MCNQVDPCFQYHRNSLSCLDNICDECVIYFGNFNHFELVQEMSLHTNMGLRPSNEMSIQKCIQYSLEQVISLISGYNEKYKIKYMSYCTNVDFSSGLTINESAKNAFAIKIQQYNCCI